MTGIVEGVLRDRGGAVFNVKHSSPDGFQQTDTASLSLTVDP